MPAAAATPSITLFVCGDVMTGRGIDQILAHPCDPAIHERYMQSALGYVEIAEERNGRIPRPVDPSYIWGDGLGELQRLTPDARIINLETAVTRSDDWVGKGINYRMNPAHVACLSAARIDCCALANNHVLDWGTSGLLETLDTLHAAGLKTAGAGKSRIDAEAPAEIALPRNRRLLVFSLGAQSSGVPPGWAATDRSPGVDFLSDLSERTVGIISRRVRATKQPGDIAVASLHWGPNWGYEIAPDEVRFAHQLIERAGIDLIHGHSSHHPKAIEVFHGKLILYGCGDFINDYEGITGYEAFRGDLGLMYFPTLDAGTGRLRGLELVATQMKRFRVRRASDADARWLASVLDREGGQSGTWTEFGPDGRIELRWAERAAAGLGARSSLDPDQADLSSDNYPI
jgi:poly-gamma-glutamate capsule biosynthesis protein CapA/YwtB (metallophosphatase superfamily)